MSRPLPNCVEISQRFFHFPLSFPTCFLFVHQKVMSDILTGQKFTLSRHAGEKDRQSRALLSLSEAGESVDSFDILVRQTGGSRASARDSIGSIAHSLPVENLADVLKAIEMLQELGRENNKILESKSIIRWIAEVVRVHLGFQEEGCGSLYESLTAVAGSNGEGEEVWGDGPGEELSSVSTYASSVDEPDQEGDNAYLDDWLHGVFLQDPHCKMKSRHFLGGAEEAAARSTPELCPHCNRPVGCETDQHIWKCKFAHEEQERLQLMLVQIHSSRVQKEGR
jgi:hypothetical protein